MSFLKKILEEACAPVSTMTLDEGVNAWGAYFIETPNHELSKDMVGDFLKYATCRFNETDTKRRIGDRLGEIYEANPLELSLGKGQENVNVSVLDKAFFMKNESIGSDRGPLMGEGEKYTPNIVFSNIRSAALKPLASPIGIFPNTYLTKENNTAIYLFHGFDGAASKGGALAVMEWAENVSDKMYECVAKEYVEVLNDFFIESMSPKLIGVESGGSINFSNGASLEVAQDGRVDEDLIRAVLK
jgi:hypothetical protein